MKPIFNHPFVQVFISIDETQRENEIKIILKTLQDSGRIETLPIRKEERQDKKRRRRKKEKNKKDEMMKG